MMRIANTRMTAFFSSALVAAAMATMPAGAQATEEDAKNLLRSMSDYLASQQNFSFRFDTDLEVVTAEEQKLAFASSGTMTVNRPDKVRATRTGGFADVELVFDGKTITLLGKTANAYGQVDVPGSIDDLIDELRETYHRPIPGADLLSSNVYDTLMDSVVDVKDLGSGVINGVECNHFAFRSEEVDWQIWIAIGDTPYPCRYRIASKTITGHPQYSVEISDWKAGDAVADDDFAFANTTGAREVSLADLPDMDELPAQYTPGETK